MGYFSPSFLFKEDILPKSKQVRRRWSREDKLAIISEIGVDGATVLDVSRRHKMDCYLLKRNRPVRAPEIFLDRPLLTKVSSSMARVQRGG